MLAVPPACSLLTQLLTGDRIRLYVGLQAVDSISDRLDGQTRCPARLRAIYLLRSSDPFHAAKATVTDDVYVWISIKLRRLSS